MNFRSLNYQVAALGIAALLFVVVGHLSLPNGGGHALYLPFNTLSWGMIFLLLAVSFWRVGAYRELFHTTLTRQLALACLVLTLPMLYWHAHWSEAWYRMLALWVGLAVLIGLRQLQFQDRHWHLALLIVLAGVWVEAGRYWWAMMQEFAATGSFPSGSQQHLHGVFQQRNVLSSFIATGLVLSAYLLGQLQGTRLARWCYPLLLVSPLIFVNMIQSLASRAGWYGAAIGVLLVLPVLCQKVQRKWLVLWGLSLLAGFGLSWLLSQAGGWSAPGKSILTLAGPRTYLFPQSIAMFLDSPLFGFGYGTFESSYTHFAAQGFANGDLQRPALPTTFHPHNELLLWAVEGGVVALVGILFAAAVVWLAVMKLGLTRRLAIIGLFFPIVLHSQVEFPFYASAMHYLVFILLIAYVDYLTQAQQRRVLAAPKLVKTAAVAVPGLAVLFLITTLSSGIVLERFNANRIPMSGLAAINNAVVWRDRINFSVNLNLLLAGLQARDVAAIRAYADWAPELLEREPRPIFYEYLIIAHNALGETQRVQELTAQFRYLFPHTEFRYFRPSPAA